MHTAVVKVSGDGHLASQILWVCSSRDGLGAETICKFKLLSEDVPER